MSLINEMLRDLDARRAPNGGAAVPAEVRVVRSVSAPDGSGARTILLVSAGILALTAAGWWVWQQTSNVSVPGEMAPPPTVIASVDSPPPTSESAALAAPAEPWRDGANGSGEPEAAGTARRSDARPLISPPAPRAIAPSTPPTPPRTAAQTTAPADAPALRFADSLAKPPEVAGSQIDKRVVPLSAAERAAESHRRALLAAQAGQAAEARQLAEAALRDVPGHVGARQLLVRVLLDGRQDAEAMALLAQAQREFPDDLQWALLLARLNMESKGAGPALAQLRQVAEPPSGSHEYRAMLATLHHRLGDSQSAVEAYRGALQLAPQEGRYWAGLAIALDQQGEGEAAQQAYRQAAADTSLPPSLATLVRERLR